MCRRKPISLYYYSRQWHNLENCGKNVVANAGCARMQLLSVEATFANMMITTATFCGDKCKSISVIRKTCPCNKYPFKPQIYSVKMGFAGVYLFFLIFDPKHRLWVLVRTASLADAVLTCTHNLCFEQILRKKYQCFPVNIFVFTSKKISVYWMGMFS